MPSDDRLARHLESFFDDYMIRQRSVSPNTLLSYRDALKLFLCFAAKDQNKDVVDLRIDDLHVDVVLRFLDHLEHVRKNSIPTRNIRLAALHTFFRHVAGRDPQAFALAQRVVSIPFKRAATRAVTYLERDELEDLLQQIDRGSPMGRRDYALISLTYQTGARVQEILNLRAHDLQLTQPASVRLWGKGKKERVLPLWNQAAALLTELLQERNIDPRSADNVFVNQRGQQLTRWGFRHLLKKYAAAAAAQGSRASGKRVHPHCLRHTTAVHMLQAGADPNTIRDYLGHANTETTWRYARITLEMKRKALESCPTPADPPPNPVPRWHRDDDLLAQLERLGRPCDYVKSLGKGR